MPRYNYVFDPFELTGVEVPRKNRKKALEKVAEFVQDEFLQNIGEGKSPVAGGPWKRSLTPEYKEKKGGGSSAGFANLEFEGDLLDAFSTRVVGGKIDVGVDASQAGKAEGNNIGSYGMPAGDNSKARRFIPLEGEKPKAAIVAGIRRILEEFEE